MKRSVILITVVIFVFVLTSHAVAQDFYIGVKFGLSQQKTKFEELEAFYTTEYSTVYGFCIGMKFMSFGLEAHYFHSDHHLIPKEEPPPELSIERFKLNVIGANILYYLPIPVVQPYLSVGMGTYNVDVVGFAKDDSIGYNFGVGANIRVTELVSLSADGKYHLVKFNLNQYKMDLKEFTWYASVNFHF
ncbi:MAG: porin family protein [Candidatus Aminicenantes bacterium]|nr:MAG: porin family protein [Candidatus Aminicenantes bacterium]